MLPEYTVRYSNRAKHVRLSISAQKGLEVVLPFHSSADCIPELLQRKRDWIKKHLVVAPSKIKACLPEYINLQAIGLSLEIAYIANSNKDIDIILKKGVLQLEGNVKDEYLVQQTLIESIKCIAKVEYTQWVASLANIHGYQYSQVKVGAQKTRWGSCSSKGNINLNYKLLFMPPSYCQYVLLHELAHTRFLNHSKAFWDELESALPDSKMHDKKMKEANRYIPQWISYEFSSSN
jgi:predicted metal-dependent hydrolase